MNRKYNWIARFVCIIGSQFISQVGSSAAQFALLWWLAVKTDSAVILALAGSVGFLPNALLSPFAGVWIDRLNRKLIMITADLYIALCACVLLFYSYIEPEHIPVWLVLLIMGLRSIGAVFHTPAWNAMMPELVPKPYLDRVAGWNQVTVGSSNLIGPALGGILAAVSLNAALLVDIMGAVLACGILLLFSIPNPKPAPGKNVLRELQDGLRLMLHDKTLMELALPMLAAVLFFLPTGSLFPLMTNSYFGKSALHSSLAVGAFGAGLLASSLLTGIRGLKIRIPFVFGSVLVVGILMFLSGFLPASFYWLFVVFAAAVGFAGSMAVLSLFVHIQSTIPEEALGRVFAVLFSIISYAAPVGLFIAAPFAETYGINVWFIIAGCCIILAGAGGMIRIAVLARKNQ